MPQKVGRTRGWQDDFFGTHHTVQHKRDFLQQLRDSVTFFDAQAESAARTPAHEDIKAESGFKYHLRSVPTDGDPFKSNRRRFEESKNEHHSASRLKLKRVFELVDEPGAEVHADLLRNEHSEIRQKGWPICTLVTDVVDCVSRHPRSPSSLVRSMSGHRRNKLFGTPLKRRPTALKMMQSQLVEVMTLQRS